MSRENRRNFYRVLQVQPDAPTEVIKASYRTLMQKLKAHPDLGGDSWNAAVINEAYAVLSDPGRRAEYDRQQDDLKRQVGKAARANGSQVTPTTSGPTPTTGRARAESPQPLRDVAASTTCPFCGNVHSTGGYHTLEFCSRCHASLKTVLTDDTGRGRMANRIEHGGDLSFVLQWPPLHRYRAAVVNLSPTGIQIVSPVRLPSGQRLKLESDSLNAVAVVSRCEISPASAGYRVGAQFLTLDLRRTTGTFFSASV